MRMLILIALLLCSCGDGDNTTINFASGSDAVAGDPVTTTQSQCGGSEDQCAQQLDDSNL